MDLDRPVPSRIDSILELWLFCSGLYWGKTNGRGGGAIITLGFECVQMTVGTRLHTGGMVEGMTTIISAIHRAKYDNFTHQFMSRDPLRMMCAIVSGCQ
jgi:hypothetical protein